MAESLPVTSADIAAWVTAGATCAIGFGGLGAFLYAAKTYGAQAEQLRVARADSARMRIPVLSAELDLMEPGGARFLLKVRLSSPEAIPGMRLVVASPHKCPIGFTTGQEGVEPWPDADSLPDGWQNATARPEARLDTPLLPGAYAQWAMEFRKQHFQLGDGSAGLTLRAEGELASGEPWSVPVPVTATEGAASRLSVVK